MQWHQPTTYINGIPPDSPTRHSVLWIPQGTFLRVEKLVHSGLEGTEKYASIVWWMDWARSCG